MAEPTRQNFTNSDAYGTALRKHLRDRIKALEEVAHHLRHCVECSETDVLNCPEGRELWEAAQLPVPTAAEPR